MSTFSLFWFYFQVGHTFVLSSSVLFIFLFCFCVWPNPVFLLLVFFLAKIGIFGCSVVYLIFAFFCLFVWGFFFCLVGLFLILLSIMFT